MRVLHHILIVLCVSVCTCVSSISEASIEFSERCLSAQRAIFRYNLPFAKAQLSSESNANPNNVAVDYLMVLHCMLDYTTNETTAKYTLFDSLKHVAVKSISTQPDDDGTRDFLLEEIYFYSSIVNGKKGNNLSAANDVRNCYKYGSQVLSKHPEYHAAKKTLGLLQSGFGSLPTNYQKLVQFFGFESSMENGLDQLNSFIQCKSNRPEWQAMKTEAHFFVASIYLYLKNDKAKAWQLIDSLTSDHKVNPLSRFARVNFADKCHKNEEIIRVITSAKNKNQEIPFLSFMLGKAKLNRLDNDADTYLLQYVKHYKGQSYIKSCYQKLSWHALIHDDETNYNKYRNLIRTKGNTALEEDEQAQEYADQQKEPNILLLKTRLLFDGGYNEQALKIIRPKKAPDFTSGLERTEYFYRKGRIYDALENLELAQAFYLEAMSEGRNLPQYYASYAALYLAEMHERKGNLVEAKKYFNHAMGFEANKEYKKSIEHRAKNGLERIEQN